MERSLDEAEGAEVVETVVVAAEVEDVEAEVARLSRTVELWWWESIRGTRLYAWILTEETCALPTRDRLVAQEQPMEDPVVKMLELLSTNVLL